MGGFHRYQSLSYEVKVVFFSSIEVGYTKIDKISAFRNKSSFHKLAPQGERLLNFMVKILKLMEHCQKAHVKAWKLDFPLAAVKKNLLYKTNQIRSCACDFPACECGAMPHFRCTLVWGRVLTWIIWGHFSFPIPFFMMVKREKTVAVLWWMWTTHGH